jgi:tetratricopeptide (TPR) repeat protein
MSMARFEEAALLFRKVLPFAKTLEERIELCHKQAHSWVLGGFGPEGVEAAEEGIALVKDMPLEQLSNLEGYYLNELYRRMTESYIHMGDYEKAVEYGRKALSFCDRFVLNSLDDNHGWVEFHLARALMFAQAYAEAEQVIRDAIERFERADSMWSANYAYDLLGQILINREQYEEALDLNARAAKILEPFFGKEHADIAQNLEYRGNIYGAMGQREKAEGFYRQAVEIYRKCNCRKRAEKTMKKLL